MFCCNAPHRHPRKLVATALILAFHASAVLAGQTASIDIPTQPLSSALRALASQTGIQLVFSADTVGAARGNAVKGNLSVEEALRQLLAGSELEYHQEGERNYVVMRPAQVEHSMAEMVVTATRTERRVDEVPASVSVITSRDIERQQVLKVEDALKNVEGVDFNTVPGNAAASVPLIRGVGGSFAGATSAVLVDSMATDSYISSVVGRGGFNFLATQDVERIEVVRGPASALYGPNVVGGLVNVIPKKWTGKTGAEVNVGTGSHNSKSLGAVAGTANDRFDIRLSAYDFKTDGYVAKPDPDRWGQKDTRNRGWQDTKWNLSGAVRPSDDQEVGFTIQQFRTTQDYMGGLTDSSQKLEGDAYTTVYRKDFAEGNRLKLSYRHGNLLQSWSDSPAGMGVGHRKSITDTIEGQIDLHPLAGNTLSLGASYQAADFETVSLTSSSRTTASAKSSGVFVQDEHRFGNLVATVGGRYDYIDQGASTKNGMTVHNGASESTFNPRGGLRYHFSPATSVYASAGTAFVPANANLKYLANGNWRDNPDLKPETSVSYEVGANHTLGYAAIRAALYHTDYTDMISAVSVGPTTWPRQYVNIGKVAVDGVELGIDGNLPGGWKPYANYTYTDSVIKKNPTDPLTVGKHTQRIAPHKFNFGVAYVPNKIWNARFAGRYTGERYFTDRNTPDRRASGYFVGDAKFTARIPSPANAGQWNAYLAINNVFDKKYVVWEDENADRRNFWIGVNGRF